MVSSTIRSIALVVSILGPISIILPNISIISRSGRQATVETRGTRSNRRPNRALSRYALSEVLMASTYPLEVVQAERWLNETKV